MNKKALASVVLVVLAIVFVICGLLFFKAKSNTQIVAENKTIPEVAVQKVVGYRAQLDYAEGQVEKRLNAESGWLAAENGDVFASGMEVRTLTDSKAIVTFEDGSAARLDQNTQIKITTGENAINLEMPRGVVFNKVSKDPTREYVVSSGNYSMKALGTVFSVSNEDGTDLELLVLESQVEMKKSGDDLAETAAAGEKIAIADSKIEKKKIEQKDLDKKFVAWNITKDKMEVKLADEKKETTKKEIVKTNVNSSEDDSSENNDARITLSSKSNDDGIKLSWQTENLGSFDGFKLVKSKDANPVYPGDTYKYFSGSGTKTYTWGITDGNKYHFRVCKYAGGKCVLYSNDVSETAPKKSSSDDEDDEDSDSGSSGDYATGVSLSGSKDGTTAKLSWSISGGSAPLGFKVVKSTSRNPVYPGNDYQYLSSSSVRSYNWSGFSAGETYHFRVCIYKGGSCGAYSDDVEISF